jgi:para-aminobenzoate synthetase/4-amino-4-deoxychorismate lyase
MAAMRINSFIGLNDVLLKNKRDWLHFRAPHQVISAHTLQDVVPSLQQIEALVNSQGWHAAGFVSYEAASAFDPALQTHALPDSAGPSAFPYLWFGLYPEPRAITLPEPVHPGEAMDWQPATALDDYNAAIAQIRDHIGNGRTYQVNYTLPLRTKFVDNPWEFFLRLAHGQNNHAAYLDTGRYVICSASPELFFQLDGSVITCRPMKGTTNRGRTTDEDRAHSDWLKNSAKNRAENVMIVDMLRNDLGRIAEIGSLRVPHLFETERYPTLWQMTSTVTARTKASFDEIFTALFPCASITGAPKVSAMKIIKALEKTPRRIYTGSIGYLAPNRTAKFNVAIRTAWIDRSNQTAEYGVGGGIVWDSTSEDEYAEILLKSRVLIEDPSNFSLLETMLWTPAEKYVLRERHLARMLDSADYFDIPVSKLKLNQYLDRISSKYKTSKLVRILLDPAGKMTSKSSPHRPAQSGQNLNVRLANRSVDSADVFLFHKTTQREIYESARTDLPGLDDVLLHNERGELTEFTVGNLVVEWGGQLFTPPVACGVLPGTFRAHLLENGRIAERTIRIENLMECTKLFRVNSVRQWQEAELRACS